VERHFIPPVAAAFVLHYLYSIHKGVQSIDLLSHVRLS